ncbi:hypothetical protein QJS10_CPB22g00251 [Acorus calamus]|uniref:Uncharacterized protein n=1 Tax=Acorus calamus TaxID=4465 RepID=A0AAV9C173_ACOCL|nr:hypothetical protein QJS10_CPB22g00251 [Acorus calamus]
MAQALIESEPEPPTFEPVNIVTLNEDDPEKTIQNGGLSSSTGHPMPGTVAPGSYCELRMALNWSTPSN